MHTFDSMEVFKTIPSFPDYEVSNFGRVKTKQRKVRYVHAITKEEHFRITESKFLKVQYNKRTGYKFHQLYRDKKMHNVNIHKLVSEAFLPHEQDKDTINHIDGNKHNNVIENLERCSNLYNHEHATKTGLKASGGRVKGAILNDRMIHAIRYLSSLGLSHVEISKAFQVSRSNISLICEGKTWKNTLTGRRIKYPPP